MPRISMKTDRRKRKKKSSIYEGKNNFHSPPITSVFPAYEKPELQIKDKFN